MTDPSLAHRLSTAHRLAQEAGALALRLRPPPGAPAATLKGAQDWVTEADLAVEQFLSDALGQAFPDDGFQGEEGGRARTGAWRWVVDPIDGTSNYARGGTRWCVSLGLVAGRTPLLGVIVAPALGEVFDAVQGGGARLNDVPIRAAATTDMARAMVECGWSPRIAIDAFLGLSGRMMAAGAALRFGGSGALALVDVACGRLDAYVEAHINLWDVAAALAILAESGAVVSDFMAGAGPDSGAAIQAAAPGVAARVAEISGIAF